MPDNKPPRFLYSGWGHRASLTIDGRCTCRRPDYKSFPRKHGQRAKVLPRFPDGTMYAPLLLRSGPTRSTSHDPMAACLLACMVAWPRSFTLPKVSRTSSVTLSFFLKKTTIVEADGNTWDTTCSQPFRQPRYTRLFSPGTLPSSLR